MGSDWSCHSGTPLISCLRDHFKSESNSAHEREWRPQHCGGSARQRGAGPGPGEAGGGGLHPAGSEQVTVWEQTNLILHLLSIIVNFMFLCMTPGELAILSLIS